MPSCSLNPFWISHKSIRALDNRDFARSEWLHFLGYMCIGRGGENNMAKKPVIREPSPRKISTESELEREVIAILTSAGWTANTQDNHRRRFSGDILASHTELSGVRRYAIECVFEINDPMTHDYSSRFQNWLRQSRVPFADFDEFWLVGYKYATDQVTRNPGNDRRFRVFDLNELRAVVAPPPRGRKSKSRTKIGKAVEVNKREITLAVAGLILQIDARIEALRRELPNSDEAIAECNAQITEYERIRTELEYIRTMIVAFEKGAEKEAKVVGSLETFAGGIASWWNKRHDIILTKTFDLGLFMGAVSICSMAGAGGNMAAAVSAAFVGGKPVAQALKGLIPKRLTAD
jgi:hypothetical protein